MNFNTTDISKVEFAFVDDRLLFAKCGQAFVGKTVSDFPPKMNFILEDLINVVDCRGPFDTVKPAIVKITDNEKMVVQDWKFSCKRLDLSFNFFNKGLWLEIEVGNFKQRVPLHWELYKHRVLPENVVFH